MCKKSVKKYFSKPELTILVNSCDKYLDILPVFFQMFEKKWADCPYEIVLNTEKETFSCPSFDIKCYTVNKETDYAWSKRLYLNLEKIKTKYVLFMLDDFYFEENVINSQVEDLLSRIDKIKNFACLYLSDLFYNTSPCYYDKKSSLYKIHPFAKHKANATCAIWNRKFLMKILRPKENPWEFEEKAFIRTFFTNKRFYSQYNETYSELILGNDKEKQKVFHVNFSHQIKQGKWIDSCVNFLQDNGIEFNFLARGIIESTEITTEHIIKRKEYYKKRHYESPFLYGLFFIVKGFFGIKFHKK